MPWARWANANNYALLGQATSASDFTTSGTHTTFQDNGLSVSVTYGASRILRVSVGTQAFPQGGANGIAYRVLRGATVVKQWQMSPLRASSVESDTTTMTAVVNGPATAATETFKVQIRASANNTAVKEIGTSDFARYLTIEDLGPQ